MALEQNILRIDRLFKELDSLRPIDKLQEELIMEKFRLEWNYNSNQIEGNSLTYGETKGLLLHGITAQGKPLKDHIEMQGHNEALNYIEDVVKEERPINDQFIRDLNKLILKEDYQVPAETQEGLPTTKWVRVGKYKTESNSVRTRTGKVFRFTEPGDVIAEMDQLIQWYREEKEKDNYNSLLTAAEFHYRFIIIHPFDDGNGRTARILMNFILMKDGFPPIIIPTEEKPTYLNALEQGDTGNFEPFYTYLSDKLIVSLSLMISGAKGEKISDDNDMSKKLAVLKNKLASIPQKHKMIPRKSGRVARVLEEGMLPALKMVQNFHVGMKEYFVSAMIETEHNNETVGPQVAPLDFEAIFYNIDKKSVSRFGAVYYLQTLEKALPAKVSYRYSVYVEFKKDEYRLFFQSDGANYSIMGFYGDKVDVADIKDKTNKMLDSVIQGIDKSLES